MSRRTKTSLPPPDIILLVLAGILLLFGLVALTSASGVVAYNKFGDSFFYVRRQLLFGFLPGIVFFLVGLMIPYNFWRRVAFPFFLATLFLLALVLIPGIGVSYGRARSWFAFSGFSLQPVEFAKVGMIFVLALWYGREEGKRTTPFPLLLAIGLVGALLLLQPDIGSFALLVAIGIIVYFVSGALWRHLFFIGACGAAVLAAAIAWAPYRLARVLTLFQPERDPTGGGYQLLQSLVAIGSGGWRGVGLGASRQKLQYLPEVAADSIFSIIAEELGFVVIVLFLALFGWFIYRGLRVAVQSPDQFSRLVVVGVVSWFTMQAVVNIGSMLGLLPLTGLPLPFVSYGGTALAASLFAIGIVANISRYSRL